MGTRGQIALLIALTLAIYLGSAFTSALFDDADSVHAEAALEMAQRGGWVTLYANGIRYLEKAPLLYWGMALSYKLLGVWEFPARLPIVLGAVLFTLALYLFGRTFLGERAGFYAGLAGPTSFGVYLFTRITIPDILLALFITTAHYCFLAAIGDVPETTRPRFRAAVYWYAMYAAIALAVLTKGLIGVIFPAVTVGAYLLLTGRFRWAVIREMRLVTGSLLFLAIAAPWHVAAGLHNERFFWFYFMNEHFLRYLGKRVPPDYDKVPLVLFWGLHAVWVFPWTPFLVLAARSLPRTLRSAWGNDKTESPRSQVPGPRYGAVAGTAGEQAAAGGTAGSAALQPDASARDRVLLFVWLWAVLVILFFSFSTRQEYYTFVAYPALVLLATDALARAETVPGKALLWAHRALFGIGAGVAGLLAAMVLLSLRAQVQGGIASTLTRNPQYYALSLGHFFDLTPESFATLRVPAIGAAFAFLAGTWAALAFRKRALHLQANLALALMAALFFFFVHSAMNVFGPYMSSKELAVVLRQELRPGDRIVINGEYESGSTLNFYTGHQVYILNGRSSNLWWGSFYPDAPRIFLDNEAIARAWNQPGRVFLFTPAEDRAKLEKVIGPARVFAQSGGKLLLTNR